MATLSATTLTGEGSGITSIDGENIQTDSITATQIGENAVGSSEIAENAVGSSEIAEDAVGSSEIGTGAVGLDEVADGSLGARDLDFSTDAPNGQSIDERFVNESDLPDFSDWDQDVNDDLTMADFTGWDDDASDDLTTTTVFEGDVSATITDVSGVKHVDVEVSSTGHDHPHDHPHTHDYAPPHDHPYAPAGHTHPGGGDVPQRERAFAHGHCDGGTESNTFNVSNCSTPATGTVRVTFTTAATDANYTVILTHATGGAPSFINYVSSKSSGYFQVRNNNGAVSTPEEFDFVVFLP